MRKASGNTNATIPAAIRRPRSLEIMKTVATQGMKSVMVTIATVIFDQANAVDQLCLVLTGQRGGAGESLGRPPTSREIAHKAGMSLKSVKELIGATTRPE